MMALLCITKRINFACQYSIFIEHAWPNSPINNNTVCIGFDVERGPTTTAKSDLTFSGGGATEDAASLRNRLVRTVNLLLSLFASAKLCAQMLLSNKCVLKTTI